MTNQNNDFKKMQKLAFGKINENQENPTPKGKARKLKLSPEHLKPGDMILQGNNQEIEELEVKSIILPKDERDQDNVLVKFTNGEEWDISGASLVNIKRYQKIK